MRRLPPVEELVAAQGNIVLKTFSVEDKGPQGDGVDILSVQPGYSDFYRIQIKSPQ